MEDQTGAHPLVGALEHLTGPSRGRVTWLGGSTLDVSLRPNRFLRVSETPAAEAPDDLIARLHGAEDTYEIEVPEGRSLWVNGDRVTARKLEHRDMIEFGEFGPVSRFLLYGENRAVRKGASDILRDGLAYLRVSRRPIANRVLGFFAGCFSGFMGKTTLVFRVSVILSIAAIAALAYQQYRLTGLLQQRVERGATQLQSFAGALARTRKEALTPSDLKSLRRELGNRLSSNAERLADVERRSQASARVIAASMPSVVFLQGAYGFRETSSGRMLRHVVGADGRPLISPMGQPMLSLEGEGPTAERQFTGTGFAVGDGGALVTNRHVALPWESDANFKAMAGRGLEPVMIKYLAYVPGKVAAGAVELVRASGDADLAVLRRKDAAGAEPMSGLRLADKPPVPGDEVIVMGYLTGLRSMLAQSGEDFIEELQKTENTEFWSVAARLAEKGYIVPLASRGIVGQASLATIVYDAETTLGGSGGPVLDVDGSVVAVNAAILPEYGGSNLGVPVAKVLELLDEAGLR